MGIKQLNSFLKQSCKNSIKKVHFNELSNKKIAIDISIYLYKFLEDGSIIDNLYLMIGLFRKYNIIPVFIFDGKPPKEKNETIRKRLEQKKQAKQYIISLEERLHHLEKKPNLNTQEEIFKIKNIMKQEFKKTLRLTRNDIKISKELIHAYGACYLEATGEADNLCAELVKKKLVYGCLSEDMDMFVYGCNRVFRNMNIYNETIDYYDYNKILKQLKLSSKEFREICVYSGTDYNEGNHIFQTFKLFKIFKKNKSKNGNFYEWLVHQNYIKDNIQLYQTYFMFDIMGNNLDELHDSNKKINIKLNDVNKSNLNSILRKSGFIIE